MKTRIALTGIAAAIAAISTPSFAQTSVSGTVTLDGTVDAKCLVTTTGAVPSPDFGGAIHLSQLDDGTTGKLRAIGTVSAGANTNLNFRVVCTTATPAVSVTSTALKTGTGTAPTGYANTVHYSSTVAFDIAGSGTPTNVTTVTDGTATSTSNLPGRLATSPTNIHVSATSFHTPGLNDVLVAGTYNGSIAITVSPN